MKVEDALSHARSIFYAYMTLCGVLTLLTFRADPRENYAAALDELRTVDKLAELRLSSAAWLKRWPLRERRCALPVDRPPSSDDKTPERARSVKFHSAGSEDQGQVVDCVRCEWLDPKLVELTRVGADPVTVLDALFLLERPKSAVSFGILINDALAADNAERLAPERSQRAGTPVSIFVHGCTVVFDDTGQPQGALDVALGEVGGIAGTFELPLEELRSANLQALLEPSASLDEISHQLSTLGSNDLVVALAQRAGPRFTSLWTMPGDILEQQPRLARARVQTRKESEAARAHILGFDIPVWLLRISAGSVVLLFAAVWAIHMKHLALHFARPENADAIRKFPWIATFEGKGYRLLTLALVLLAPLTVTVTGPSISYYVHGIQPSVDRLAMIGLVLSCLAAGLGGYTVQNTLAVIRRSARPAEARAPGSPD